MLGKIVARMLALSLAFFLMACGGNGDSTDLAPVPGGGSGGDGGAGVGSVTLLASPDQLASASGATSTLTALVKDSNGVLVPNVAVEFKVNNNATVRVDNPVTDESGTATAILSTAEDSRNRNITVEATAGGRSTSITIPITGTTISIAGPSAIALGDTAPYRITLTDGNGDGINNEEISVSAGTSTVTSSSLTTTDGVVDVQLTSQASGQDVLTVSAFTGESRVEASQAITVSPETFSIIAPAANAEINLNTAETVTLNWENNNIPVNGSTVRFSTTRGTLVPADGVVTTSNGQASVQLSSNISGPATVTARADSSGLSTERTFEFVATTANSISVQATKTQLDFGETTEILAVARDQNNNLVKNQLVIFQIISDGSSGTLSSSSGVTDSLGRVSTTYTGGQSITSRDGVEIRANTASSNAQGSVFLTVARRALRVVVGTGNTIFEPTEASYRKPYIAIVTDANGAPVEGATVELSLLPIEYAKGTYQPSFVGTSFRWQRTPTARCPAEDTNQNGVLDPSEDVNNNGKLEPTNPATVSTESVLTTAEGSAEFDLVYPQNVCNWTKTRLTATVRVGGTESVENSEFYLSCAADDLNDESVDPPGGTESLYGSSSNCFDTQ